MAKFVKCHEDMKKSIATAQGGLPMDVSQVY